MLANIIKPCGTGCVGPKPPSAAIVTRAVFLTPLRQTPERHCYFFTTSGPSPDTFVLRITYCAHPVLARGITPMTTPQFP